MYKIKQLIIKLLNRNINTPGKVLKTKRSNTISNRKLFVKKPGKKIFKRRKKQLSLNINNIKFLNISNTNKIILIVFLLVLFSSLIAFIIFGPYFKIKNINIIKEDNITNISIAYKGVESLRGKSIFGVDKKNLFIKLISYQQNIKYMDIKTVLPNTLKITVGSYKGLFNTIYDGNNKNYIILENGTLIPSKIDKELKSIKIVNSHEKKLDNFLDYKKIYKGEYIKKINYLVKKIEENIIDIEISDLIYYVIEREIHIKIKNNLLMYSLDELLDEQIEKTVIFNKEYHPLKNDGIYYTDLRIIGKIFYCPTEEENKCIKNIKSIY